MMPASFWNLEFALLEFPLLEFCNLVILPTYDTNHTYALGA